MKLVLPVCSTLFRGIILFLMWLVSFFLLTRIKETHTYTISLYNYVHICYWFLYIGVLETKV